MLFRWPAGGVAGGSKLEVPTSQMDIMPTLLEVVGSKSKGLELDGVSVLNHLKGKDEKPPHEFMFHHCGTDIVAMRWVKSQEEVESLNCLSKKLS